MAQTGSDSSLGRWDAGIVRVVAGLLLCAAGLAGQVEKPAPDATRETLAVSSTAKVPTSDADLVVGLRHATPESCADWNATSNCRDLKHWTAVLGDDRFVLDGKSLEAFEVRLSAQGKAERGRDGKPLSRLPRSCRFRSAWARGRWGCWKWLTDGAASLSATGMCWNSQVSRISLDWRSTI